MLSALTDVRMQKAALDGARPTTWKRRPGGRIAFAEGLTGPAEAASC
jgi:hypothetical protein